MKQQMPIPRAMQTISNISLKSDISICRLIERFPLKSDVNPSIYFSKIVHRKIAQMQSNNRKPHFATNDKQNRKLVHKHTKGKEKSQKLWSLRLIQQKPQKIYCYCTSTHKKKWYKTKANHKILLKLHGCYVFIVCVGVFLCRNDKKRSWHFCLNSPSKAEQTNEQMNKRKPCDAMSFSSHETIHFYFSFAFFSAAYFVSKNVFFFCWCLIWAYIYNEHPKGNYGL